MASFSTKNFNEMVVEIKDHDLPSNNKLIESEVSNLFPSILPTEDIHGEIVNCISNKRVSFYIRNFDPKLFLG